ncbi:MAG: CxxC-x17-CxxC domain-containing protein [Candidatus Micrarchaeota archaeon]
MSFDDDGSSEGEGRGRGGGGGGGYGHREMHKTKCSECGTDCEVPFKPTDGRPVYCNACFSKRKRRY